MSVAAETIAKDQVVQALELGLDVATAGADLPRLSERQLGEIVGISTVARFLCLERIHQRCARLLNECRAAELNRLQEAVDRIELGRVS